MAYKDTSEYAFDLLEFYYQSHQNQILSLGKESIKILIPFAIFALLKSTDVKENTTFPEMFRDITLQVYDGKSIIFALKEVK